MSGWGSEYLAGFSEVNGKLQWHYDAETLQLEAWGPNAIRVRASRLPKGNPFPSENWALSMEVRLVEPTISITKTQATIINGTMTATISLYGKITITHTNTKSLILEEYARHRRDHSDPKCSALDIEARDFHPTPNSSSYHLTVRFESLSPDEKIYGMGQFQQQLLNLKGQDIELAQRNSQASVPFLVSSLGYGLLWNQPAVGRAVFGMNVMSFEALQTEHMDYWVVQGDEPKEIVEAYAKVAGTVPMMPEYGLGFWQSKCRYMDQKEVLAVAAEYNRRELPIDVLVIDFFHWPQLGDFKFDEKYWPDPKSMVRKCKEMGIELVISIWPMIQKDGAHYPLALQRGLLIQQHRGLRTLMDFKADCGLLDFTNPETRKFVWSLCKKNYYDHGIKTFWLDEAEPEYSVYHFDNYRYWNGNLLTVGNAYPLDFLKTFYEGRKAEGETDIVNLIRCAWAGSQKYGALVWSGDTPSSWLGFRNQIAAGLNMGIAGIPWWTTDIGGFHGGDATSPSFRALFARWFFFGAFSPVFRLHGDRNNGNDGSHLTPPPIQGSGGANEVWSFGPDVYKVCQRYLKLREILRPYIRGLMRQAHEKGTPVIRTMFYEFPKDEICWARECENQYLFGEKYLVAPVMEEGSDGRKVYLPKGASWQRVDVMTGKGQGEAVQGGYWVYVEAKLFESDPLFVRCS